MPLSRPDPVPADEPLAVARVPVHRRLLAAKRLVAAAGGTTEDAKRFLEAASCHGIELTHLWASFDAARVQPRQVCLAVVSSGRTATIFTTEPANAAEERELASVIDGACRALTDTCVAQTLLAPHERRAASAFTHAGFQSVGSLAYMHRATPKVGEFPGATMSGWPDGVVVRHPTQLDEPLLIEAMNRSYEGTLDCPELCGVRDTADVLTSHRSTGRFEPHLWWLIEFRGQPHGVMLFNPVPDQSTIELVYVGLSPVLRGKGLGSKLLRLGLASLAGRPEMEVTCAVDDRNEPARRLYIREGFAEFAKRVAMVKPLGESGVEKRQTNRSFRGG